LGQLGLTKTTTTFPYFSIGKYYVPAVIMRLLCCKKVITRFKVIKALKIPNLAILSNLYLIF
jgi:hypothetical protein